MDTKGNKESSVDFSTENTNPPFEYLSEDLFGTSADSAKGIYFLMTQNVSIKGKTVIIAEEDADMLLELLRNSPVTTVHQMLSSPDDYLLLRDKR